MKHTRAGRVAILWVALVSMTIMSSSRARADISPRSLETSLSGTFSNVAIEDNQSEEFFLFLSESGFFLDARNQIGVRVGLVSTAGDGAVFLDGVYTFNFVSPAARGVPFVSVAFGASDAVPFFGTFFPAGGFEPHVALGGGTRLLLGDRAAFRVEYRYDRTFGDGGLFEAPRRFRQHAILFGFSVFTTGETIASRPSPDGVGY